MSTDLSDLLWLSVMDIEMGKEDEIYHNMCVVCEHPKIGVCGEKFLHDVEIPEWEIPDELLCKTCGSNWAHSKCEKYL